MTIEKLDIRIEVTKQLIQANMFMVGELLKSPTVIDKVVEEIGWLGSSYHVRNSDNTELRQRMKALRKDMIRLEKLMEMREARHG